MCPCEEEEEETADHLIFKCNKLNKQRKEMIKQIKSTGGTWPPTYQTLVSDHLQPFVKFIKSIDFADLQSHNQKTVLRECRLILLTVR